MRKAILLFTTLLLLIITPASGKNNGVYAVLEWQGTVNIYEIGDVFLTGPKAAIGYKTNSYLSVGAFGGYLLFGDSNGNMGTGLCGIDIRTNFKRGV